MRVNWALFNNIRLLHMACVPVVVFYLVWLVNTSESVRDEEGALLDLICWPDGNAIPAIIACGSIAAVIVQLYGLYQLFKAGLCRSEANVNKGLLYYICALVMLIFMYLFVIFYAGLQSSIIRAKIKDGISKAMQRYSHHLPSKTAIDKLQTRFRCCGRLSYDEWFYIPWAALRPTPAPPALHLPSHKFVADNVPFSCCSMDVMWPCVHYGVLHVGTIYKYNPEKKLTIWDFGCEEKLVNEMTRVSWRFITVMTLITLAMVLQCIATRYLQTAYKNGLHYGNQITCEAYLLRPAPADERTQAKSWLLRRRQRNNRIVDWVRFGRRSSALPDYSDSDEHNSADDLLKYFH